MKSALDDEIVEIGTGSVYLEGTRTIRVNESGILLLAHGSGSSRHSPRNQFVAEVLDDRGLRKPLMNAIPSCSRIER